MAESPGPPLQAIVLAMASGMWAVSTRKSFAAPQYLLVVAFLVVAMISKITNGWVGGALYVFLAFAPTVMTYVILANAVDTRARLETVMALITICAAVLALHGVEQKLTGIGWTGEGLSQGTRIQYVGIFNDPNDLGLLFVMCVPMAFYLGSRGGMMGLRRTFWLTLAGLLIYGCYLTNSRGTMLALLMMLAVYTWKRYGAITAVALASAAFLGLMALPSRMQELDVSEASAMGRVEAWYEGVRMFMAHPLFGIGAGGYSDHNDLTAHNSFVLVLAEMGFIGFTIFLAIVVYCFWMTLAPIRHGDEIIVDVPLEVPDDLAIKQWRIDRALTLSLLLSLSGFFTSAFFLSRSYVVILYVLVALVVANYSRLRKEYPSLPEFSLARDMLRWLVYGVIGVIGTIVMVKVLLAVA
ncbi:O-antigen ligase family protein [Pseudoxanthomonas mexicana]